MGILDKIFSGGASTIVSSVGEVLDKVVTTKEEKMALENEMRKAEMQYQIDLKRLSLEEIKAGYQDIASARDREAEIQTDPDATRLGKNVSSYLALGTTLLTLVLFYTVIFRYKEIAVEGSNEILLYILGVMSAVVTQVFSYYFGSSRGSTSKNALISHLQSRQNK